MGHGVVTPDVIGVILAAFGAAATVLAGVAGLRRRMMTRIDARFDKVDARVEKVDARFDKVDARFDKVEGELGALKDELVEVKVAVARLEGPTPRLLRAPR
jgi:hypothetical protein